MISRSAGRRRVMQDEGQIVQIKDLIPVWVQSLFDNRRRVGLFTSDGSHRERIWESCRSC